MLFFSIKLVVGLGLFFLGMQAVKNSFYQVANNKLEELITICTTNIFTGILTGLLLTMLIQSSSATIVIIISLVNANLLSFKQAIGVIMGANIGTTVTIQLISFQLNEYLGIIIVMGIVLYILYIVINNQKLKYIARGVLGFSILIIGLEVLSSLIINLQNINFFTNYLVKLSTMPLLGMILSVFLTAVIQSSSALTGMIIILAKSNLITLSLAVAAVLGSNIGTCITAFIAGIGSSQTTKGAMWTHVLFNLLGVIILIPVFPLFVDLVAITSKSLPRQIANAHTIFNICNTILILAIKDIFINMVIKITSFKED